MSRQLMAAAIIFIAPFAGALAEQHAQVQAATPRAPPASVGDLIASGTLDEHSAGRNVGTAGWNSGWLVSGVLLGLIRTRISFALAANSDAALPATRWAILPENEPS